MAQNSSTPTPENSPTPLANMAEVRTLLTQYGCALLKGAFSSKDIVTAQAILEPSIIDTNSPPDYPEVTFALHSQEASGLFTALPVIAGIKKTVDDLSGRASLVHWSGETQRYRGDYRTLEVPHRDPAQYPRMTAATICLLGGVKVVVWPETADKADATPTNDGSITLEFDQGDVLLMDLERHMDPPVYDGDYSSSALHRFDVRFEDTTLTTLTYRARHYSAEEDYRVRQINL